MCNKWIEHDEDSISFSRQPELYQMDYSRLTLREGLEYAISYSR